MLTVFSFGEVSRYVAKNTYVKQADANFMMDTIKLGGGYKNIVERVTAIPQDCTHICIVGSAVNPNTQVYGQSYPGKYYGHEYIYLLSEHPELREWVNIAPLHQFNGEGDYELYREELIGLELPEIIQRICKGSSIEMRLRHDSWCSRVGEPSEWHNDRLPFIEWAESLPVEPLIESIDD